MGFRKIKILIFLLPIFFLMIFCLVANAQDQPVNRAMDLENICDDPRSPYYDPEACGDIPYYNPDTGLMETRGASDESTISSLAQKILKFSVVLGALLAVLMIMVGGFVYITSAANTSAVTIAKDMITNALIGLMIVVGSYLILWTINPDLVSLKLDIPDINITSRNPEPAPPQQGLWQGQIKCQGGPITCQGNTRDECIENCKKKGEDKCGGQAAIEKECALITP